MKNLYLNLFTPTNMRLTNGVQLSAYRLFRNGGSQEGLMRILGVLARYDSLPGIVPSVSVCMYVGF